MPPFNLKKEILYVAVFVFGMSLYTSLSYFILSLGGVR